MSDNIHVIDNYFRTFGFGSAKSLQWNSCKKVVCFFVCCCFLLCHVAEKFLNQHFIDKKNQMYFKVYNFNSVIDSKVTKNTYMLLYDRGVPLGHIGTGVAT